MTSLADQTVPQLGGRTSVLARQKQDHIELNRLLEGLRTLTPRQQDARLRRVYRLVFSHAFAEEAVLWPVLRRVIPDSVALTLQIEQEHQEVNELVTALERMPSDAPERPATLYRLVEVLREDVRDEEDNLLPRLQAAVPPRRLRALGIAWEVVRRTAPTRAHPVVSRRPPGNVLSAVPLSLLDRLRDGIDFLLQHGPTRNALALRSASNGLQQLAHRIERLPLLTRGEDASTHRS